MKVAGFGFRSAATLTALQEALTAAGGAEGLTAIATVIEKADSPALLTLAEQLGVPLQAISRERLAEIATLSQSQKAQAHFGTGSVAEAAALAAAGDGARLLGPRAASSDRMAMVAIAERNDT